MRSVPGWSLNHQQGPGQGPGPREVEGQPRRVLIVGARETGQMIANGILNSKSNVQIIGFVDDAEDVAGFPGIPVLGKTSEIEAVLQKHSVDEIVIAYVPAWMQGLLSYVSTNGCSHPEIKVVPRLYESLIGKVNFTQLNEMPLVSVNGKKLSLIGRALRRLNDIVIASVMTIVLFPIMLLAGIAVRLTSRGPVILRQVRVGHDGKLFTIYKFRSMVVDAEAKTGPVLASTRDERCTAIGNLLRVSKIDEMPQLLNVLRGEMSIVGPRPERPEFVEKFERSVPGYRLRHTTKPGITGLAQIYAGYSINVHDKLKYDLMYISNQSLLLDWKIFCMTPFKMVAGAFRGPRGRKSPVTRQAGPESRPAAARHEEARAQ